MKKIILSFIMLLSLCFVGFAPTITALAEDQPANIIYSEYKNSDGSMYQTFEIPIFQISKQNQTAYKNRVSANLSTFVNLILADKETVQISKIEDADLKKLSILFIDSDDFVGAIIVYPEAYLKENGKETKLETNKSFWYIEKYFEKEYPITVDLRDSLLLISCLEKTETGYSLRYNEEVKQVDVVFSYDYASYTKKIKSNSKFIGFDGMYYHHMFEADYNKITEYNTEDTNNQKPTPIRISIKGANAGNWYMLALVATVIITSTILLVYKLKSKKEIKEE